MADKVRNVLKDDITDIVEIHKKCFPDTLLTKFGNEFLEQYYMAYIKDNESTCYIYINDKKEKIGFLIGVINGNITRNKFFKNNFLLFLRASLRVLFRYRLVFIKQITPKIKGLFNKPKQDFRDKIASKGGILSIAILDEYRGKGIASQLLYSFEKSYSAKGESVYNLGVKKDNGRAIRFYEKMGFKFGAPESDTIDLYYKRLDMKVEVDEKL